MLRIETRTSGRWSRIAYPSSKTFHWQTKETVTIIQLTKSFIHWASMAHEKDRRDGQQLVKIYKWKFKSSRTLRRVDWKIFTGVLRSVLPSSLVSSSRRRETAWHCKWRHYSPSKVNCLPVYTSEHPRTTESLATTTKISHKKKIKKRNT
jgi:hypothetical protein